MNCEKCEALEKAWSEGMKDIEQAKAIARKMADERDNSSAELRAAKKQIEELVKLATLAKTALERGDINRAAGHLAWIDENGAK